MPAEVSTSVVHPQKDIVCKQFNKSLKHMRTYDREGDFYHNANPVSPYSRPFKRRRVDRKREGDRAPHRFHHHVATRNRRREQVYPCLPNRQLNHILGIHNKPPHTVTHPPRSSGSLHQQIKALQHILDLAQQPTQTTPQPLAPCTLSRQWTVTLSSTDCVLAKASLEVKNDLFGPHSFPTELTVTGTVHKCVWRYLKTDLSVTQVSVEFHGTEAGKQYRSMLWKTRKSAIVTLPNNLELHLIPQSAETDDDHPLLGFICPAHHAHKLARDHASTVGVVLPVPPRARRNLRALPRL